MTTIEQARAAFLERHPELSGLDERAEARLREVVVDPGGGWMDSAGLLDGDSCGYPVEGGYYDVKGELESMSSDEAQRKGVLDRLLADWADDYVLGGRARLDRPWRQYVEGRDAG